MKTPSDPRLLTSGLPIPSEGYADQPYVVQTDDGTWLCAMTTGPGHEGAGGQHVVSLRSSDHGQTWADRADVEPSDGPEASYAVLLKVPGGRIYCFYNHNTDRVREVKREDGGVFKRVDSLGHYVFKYSDDHGRTWSAQRYDVPVREFACDRENVYGGTLRFFWNVGRPLITGGAAFLVLHKVGAMGKGFFARSEGCLLRSVNILSERDPARIRFDTLPDGDIGLRAPAGGGRVAEEQSLSVLSDGSLFCVYRTVDGWPACAYSRDGGRTWTAPAYLTYRPGGRRVKHPRAANFAWRCANGRFLYWFHNHGGRFLQGTPEWRPYDDRNPAWLMAGREIDTPEGKRLEWSQPEILLYYDDPLIRMSYPDLIEEQGRFWITETQKTIGGVHTLDPILLDGLFNQWDRASLARDGLVLELSAAPGPLPAEVPMPPLPAFIERDHTRLDMGSRSTRAGFTVELVLGPESLQPGVVLDNRTPSGEGLCLQATPRGTLELVMQDGQTRNRWESDPGVLPPGVRHHVTVIVDGGPRLILFVVDGILCNGGDARQFGWGRFSPHLRGVGGTPLLRIAPAVRALRIYDRALRVSEAVGNHREEQSRP
jgi:hypothetical protein